MAKYVVLAMIILCATVAVCQEEGDPRIPAVGLCKQDPTLSQEVRFCKTFIKCMQKNEFFREAVPPESAMVFTVIAVDVPSGDKMAYSVAIALHTTQLAGFQPIVWQKAGVVSYANYMGEMEEILAVALQVIIGWLPGALEASRNLCPDPTGQYKSVGLCYEHEVDDVVSEGPDVWSFEVQ